jgi:hypothetical protein
MSWRNSTVTGKRSLKYWAIARLTATVLMAWQVTRLKGGILG